VIPCLGACSGKGPMITFDAHCWLLANVNLVILLEEADMVL
jgi:hypothetical protein